MIGYKTRKARAPKIVDPSPIPTSATQSRKIKIQSKCRESLMSTSVFPEIKLCGQWLANAGFQDGAYVWVSAKPNVLIIRLERTLADKS